MKIAAQLACALLTACATVGRSTHPSIAERLAELRPRVRSEPALALAELDELVRSAPHDANVLRVRAECLVLLDEWDRVLADLDAAIALDASQPWTHYERGVALSMVRGTAASIEAFDRAIELDPRHYKALAHRGDAHAQFGRHEQALADFTRAIECWPANFEIGELALLHSLRANEYSHLGRLEDAQRDRDRSERLLGQ